MIKINTSQRSISRYQLDSPMKNEIYQVIKKKLTPVAAPALKTPKEVGGGDFDVIFQSRSIPN